MLLWAILFLAIAIITGILAFNGVAIAASFFAKILFFVCLIALLVAIVLIIVHKIMIREKIKP